MVDNSIAVTVLKSATSFSRWVNVTKKVVSVLAESFYDKEQGDEKSE
jgi:hypothetical protein